MPGVSILITKYALTNCYILNIFTSKVNLTTLYGTDVASRFGQFLIALPGNIWPELFGRKALQRRRLWINGSPAHNRQLRHDDEVVVKAQMESCMFMTLKLPYATRFCGVPATKASILAIS